MLGEQRADLGLEKVRLVRSSQPTRKANTGKAGQNHLVNEHADLPETSDGIHPEMYPEQVFIAWP
jgi:hypothetical protein